MPEINSRCFFCNKILSLAEHEIHHFTQKCLGGSVDDPNNLVDICWNCHHNILHKKSDINTYDLYNFIYRLLCHALDILPVEKGYDDDLVSWRSIKNIPKISHNFRKLASSMILLDCFIFGRDKQEFKKYFNECKKYKSTKSESKSSLSN